MTEQTAAEALRALAQGTENRSKIGRLRGVYEEIEKAQRAGVSNGKIVETLNDQGFNLTLKTFETMLYRIRQERTKADKRDGGAHAQQATENVAKATQQQEGEKQGTVKIGNYEVQKPKRFTHNPKPDEDLLK